MKKIFLFITCIVAISLTACQKDFDDLQFDPNRATEVPPNLLLTGILSDVNSGPFSAPQRWNQFYCSNYAYYDDQEYNWTNISYGTYSTLNNVKKMEEESVKNIAAPNAYTSIAKFMKAMLYYNLTMQVGDVPLSEALKGIANTTPKYDTQKEVFQQILVWLDEANADMNTVITKGNYVLAGDIYYNNNLASWRKAVNTFKLRVLIQLSKYESDADLGVKEKFAAIINNPTTYPLIGSMADNLAYKFNSAFNKYPTSPDSYGFDAARYNMSATYLNSLITIQDPRVFMVAEPADSLVRAGAAKNSFAAFNGASSGEDLGDMSANAGKGLYSFINRKRYYSTYTAEDCIQIGYSELCFNMAEAINRGWIGGNAETWYQDGIKASHNFYGIKDGANTVIFQKVGGTLTESESFTVNFDWATYYAQTAVQYQGGANGLNQILAQKYFAFYQNSGWEAYYNWRRTNVPTFLTGPGSGNSQRVALRFQYPVSEKSVNSANVNSAITSQFAGNDGINEKMWIIK